MASQGTIETAPAGGDAPLPPANTRPSRGGGRTGRKLGIVAALLAVSVGVGAKLATSHNNDSRPPGGTDGPVAAGALACNTEGLVGAAVDAVPGLTNGCFRDEKGTLWIGGGSGGPWVVTIGAEEPVATGSQVLGTKQLPGGVTVRYSHGSVGDAMVVTGPKGVVEIDAYNNQTDGVEGYPFSNTLDHAPSAAALAFAGMVATDAGIAG